MSLFNLITNQSSMLYFNHFSLWPAQFQDSGISIELMTLMILGFIMLLPSMLFSFHNTQHPIRYPVSNIDALNHTLRYAIVMAGLSLCWCLLAFTGLVNDYTALTLIGLTLILTLKPWEELQRTRQLMPLMNQNVQKIIIAADISFVLYFTIGTVMILLLSMPVSGKIFILMAFIAMILSFIFRATRLKQLYLLYRKYTHSF